MLRIFATRARARAANDDGGTETSSRAAAALWSDAESGSELWGVVFWGVSGESRVVG